MCFQTPLRLEPRANPRRVVQPPRVDNVRRPIGDLDLSSFVCVLKMPMVTSGVRVRDVGRLVLGHLVLCGFNARTVRHVRLT